MEGLCGKFIITSYVSAFLELRFNITREIMKNYIFLFCFLLVSMPAFSQVGHVMQGVGAVNMSMGGAATAQPLDISGALQWNPASISAFDDTIIRFDLGLFFSSPELSSTAPIMDGNGQVTGYMSGTTKDDKGVSPMPAFAMVFGKEGSKHTFGVSLFGISGFGVEFPESMTNPITMPQSYGGFGKVKSNYMLMQVGLTWAYEISEQFSIGIEPTFNYSALKMMPNPTANPNGSGYPSTDNASALGYGAQIGLFYDSGMGLKAGASYKTTQHFEDFEFENTYLDGAEGKSKFQMDYPAIFSLGLGYSLPDVDIALDYRYIDYENTEGFEETGWTETASVKGFGWNNVSVVSAGIQYTGIDKLPLRVGYTYSSNPIGSDVAFYNLPATAVIENAFQLGCTYKASYRISVDLLYHHSMSNGDTSGPMLNPMMISAGNPYGAVPGSEVSYDMTTDMIMVGVSYTLINK